MKYQRKNYSFLVTCVGAYEDSGAGTGSFICINQGRTHVIDYMDSTGLFKTDKNIFRFVRSLKTVIGYDVFGIKYFLRLPETKDVHDIFVTEREIACASTGQNEIMWFNHLGKLLRTWHAEGQGYAWHLNCLQTVGNDLFASAFGEFISHREWNGKSDRAGFIFNVKSGQKIIEGLSGPHSPRLIGDAWFVCESHIHTLSVMRRNESAQKIRLNGFTRGLTYDSDFVFVGESANRKAAAVSDFSYIVVLDRKSLEIVDRIKLSFPEIYDIAIIQNEMASAIINNLNSFRFDFKDERIAVLEKQVRRGREEIFLLSKTKPNYWRSTKTFIKKLLHIFRPL